jgi:hypothetical protein
MFILETVLPVIEDTLKVRHNSYRKMCYHSLYLATTPQFWEKSCTSCSNARHLGEKSGDCKQSICKISRKLREAIIIYCIQHDLTKKIPWVAYVHYNYSTHVNPILESAALCSWKDSVTSCWNGKTFNIGRKCREEKSGTCRFRPETIGEQATVTDMPC